MVSISIYLLAKEEELLVTVQVLQPLLVEEDMVLLKILIGVQREEEVEVRSNSHLVSMPS